MQRSPAIAVFQIMKIDSGTGVNETERGLIHLNDLPL